MANLSPNLQQLTEELPADKRADVETAISSSPYLRQLMTEAVNAGTLKHIRMGAPGANEGGHYDDSKRAIYLSPGTFSDPILKSHTGIRIDAITSTLGHETGHALNAEQTRKNLYFVTSNITDQIRAAEGSVVDMTPMVGMYLRSSRQDEASAEIHGWNALASRIEHTKGHPPSKGEILQRADPSTNCVEGSPKNPALAPGIILDTDMQMSDTRLPKAGPINLEPVAQCHFDKSQPNLGEGGAANYANYYAAYLIQQIADDTRDQTYPARVNLDMATLGLDKTQLESTGMRLGEGGFYFTDTSHGTQKPVVLRSSGGGIQGTPDNVDFALHDAQTSPGRAIAQASPDERLAREQVQREANRQGLSQDEVQQAVAAPTRSMSGGSRDVEAREKDASQNDAQQKHAGNGHADPSAATPTPALQFARPADPRDPDHPDHRLYKQIEAGVARIDASAGRSFEQTSERLAMSTLADAKAAEITSADHIALNTTGKPQQDGSRISGGTLLFVVQGQDPSDPAARRSITDVAQAVERSLEQAQQKLDAVNQQQAQALAQQQDQPTPDNLGRGPRTL